MNLKLYKVYLIYGRRVVLHMYWATDIKHVYKLMEWSKEDKPKPIIKEIQIKEDCFMCHHILDYNIYEEKDKRATTARIFSLLQRLINGEERNGKLFNDVRKALSLLNKTESETETLETVLVFRTLHNFWQNIEVPLK